MKTSLELIADERQRQIEVELRLPIDDQHYVGEELAYAAACYAIPPNGRNMFAGNLGLSNMIRVLWPFEFFTFKPDPADRIKELTKAGALIVAEMERLQRENGQLPQKVDLPSSKLEPGAIVIAKSTILSQSGRLIVIKGQRFTIKEVVKSEPYWGKRSGVYYPEKVIGIRLVELPGLWTLESFDLVVNQPVEESAENNECDCQDYENGLVSNYCTVHNVNPYPKDSIW